MKPKWTFENQIMPNKNGTFTIISKYQNKLQNFDNLKNNNLSSLFKINESNKSFIFNYQINLNTILSSFQNPVFTFKNSTIKSITKHSNSNISNTFSKILIFNNSQSNILSNQNINKNCFVKTIKSSSNNFSISQSKKSLISYPKTELNNSIQINYNSKNTYNLTQSENKLNTKIKNNYKEKPKSFSINTKKSLAHMWSINSSLLT